MDDKEFSVTPVLLTGFSVMSDRVCAYPHSRDRVIVVSFEQLSVYDLVTGEITGITGGGVQPTIHHNSHSQYRGLLFMIGVLDFRLTSVDFNHWTAGGAHPNGPFTERISLNWWYGV